MSQSDILAQALAQMNAPAPTASPMDLGAMYKQAQAHQADNASRQAQGLAPLTWGERLGQGFNQAGQNLMGAPQRAMGNLGGLFRLGQPSVPGGGQGGMGGGS